VFAAPAAPDWGPPQRLPDGVNTPYYDWGVCATADGNTIYFSSDRGDPQWHGCDIYRSRRVGSSWSAPEKVPGPINSEAHEGAPCLTWDDQRMYFHRGRLGTPNGDIYASDWTGSGWGEPYKVPGQINTPDRWESNPSISGESETLYFVGDDYPGNLHAYNIWKSRWNGSDWGEPEFLYSVNTDGGEGDPSPTYDGRYLYFWSARTGVSRLYRAEDVGGEWGNVALLPPIINVAGYHYCDPFVTKDGRYLFFAKAPYSQTNNYDIYVSAWSDPAVAPASLGRIKALFK